MKTMIWMEEVHLTAFASEVGSGLNREAVMDQEVDQEVVVVLVVVVGEEKEEEVRPRGTSNQLRWDQARRGRWHQHIDDTYSDLVCSTVLPMSSYLPDRCPMSRFRSSQSTTTVPMGNMPTPTPRR